VLEQHKAMMIPQCFDEAQGRLISSIHTWVLKTAHRTILIDSCAGNHKNRPALPRFHQLNLPFLERLAEAGVSPETVDYVCCTHLHADHCGWNTRLVDGRWVPTFPSARHVFSKAEQERWHGPAGCEGFNAGVYQDSVLPVVESGQAVIVDGEAAIGDGLTFHPTPGHSVGMLPSSSPAADSKGCSAAASCTSRCRCFARTGTLHSASRPSRREPPGAGF
jgi:glyoxylase-like metal-dependent hydrolase (beta-lactamase superfamily II)